MSSFDLFKYCLALKLPMALRKVFPFVIRRPRSAGISHRTGLGNLLMLPTRGRPKEILLLYFLFSELVHLESLFYSIHGTLHLRNA